MISSLSNSNIVSFQAARTTQGGSSTDEILQQAESLEQDSDAQSALQALQETDTDNRAGGNPLLSTELTEEEEKIVRELQQTDQEVRAHEQAHKTVGGPYAGAIQYQTTTGPDGREYAIGGSVQIDVSPVPNNPEATVRKMDVVIRAALAPAEPSSEDFAVARAAQQARIVAQREAELQRQAEQAERRGDGGEDVNNSNTANQALSGEQQSQLSQLLQSINALQSPTSEARGSLIDAIN